MKFVRSFRTPILSSFILCFVAPATATLTTGPPNTIGGGFNTIHCVGSLPPADYAGWPAGRGPWEFPGGINDFCPYVYIDRRTLGCVCYSLIGGQHSCEYDLADPQLWLERSLLSWCVHRCACPGNTPRVLEAPVKDIDTESVGSCDEFGSCEPGKVESHNDDAQSEIEDAGAMSYHRRTRWGGAWSHQRKRKDLISVLSVGYPLPRSAFGQQSSEQKCLGSCDGYTCTNGCQCLATPVSKGLFMELGCGSLSLGLGRRGLGGYTKGGWACPCNSTYVSQACCNAPDRMVWEPLDLQLGRMVDSLE